MEEESSLMTLCTLTSKSHMAPKEGIEQSNGTMSNNGHSRTNSKVTHNTKEMLENRKKQKYIWPMIILQFLANAYNIIYCLPCLFYQKWQTLLWNIVMFQVGGIGQTAGAHRLWSHRSYKATLPLRVVLMLFYCVAGTISYKIYDWARDHRIHHRYTDTDLDPYSAERGLFYSHVGWLMITRHPDSLKKMREVDIGDILSDPVVVFEKKYHYWLFFSLCHLLPTLVPVMLWQESWLVAFNTNFVRWLVTVHGVSSINSLAHAFGSKPFNKNIYAVQNLFVSIVATGEGWHNYHHMFPWDYRTSDFGFMNVSMHFIRLCEFLGLASDLKTAPPDLVRRVMLKYGDGSHPDWIPQGPEIPEEELRDP